MGPTNSADPMAPIPIPPQAPAKEAMAALLALIQDKFGEGE